MLSYFPYPHLKELYFQQNRLPSANPTRSFVAGTENTERKAVINRTSQRDFTKSLNVTRPLTSRETLSDSDDNQSFVQSVTVLKNSSEDCKYSIHTGLPTSSLHEDSNAEQLRESFLESLKYKHNIGNPELKHRSAFTDLNLGMREPRKAVECQRPSHSDSCSCGTYHSHRFKIANQLPSHTDTQRPRIPQKKSHEVIQGNENQMVICEFFWKASLSFCDYRAGMKPVGFENLWPGERQLEGLMVDGLEELVRRGAVWDFCYLILADGPKYALKYLLDKNILGVDGLVEGDTGLLHLACVLHNMEAVQVLTQYGISSKIKDRNGKTAEMVCWNPAIRKQLPARYLQNPFLPDRSKQLTFAKPGLQEKEAIFKLAANPRALYELQKKLQMFNFSVNEEQNPEGDFLVHVACRAGLCQLAVLLSLVKVQGADMNLCNRDGMTPLMIVAEAGDSHLCDTLMCLFGADPNKQNTKTGKTPLHYAAMLNHVNVVSVLLKRGADVNISDSDVCLPDDLPHPAEDCQQLIQLQRAQRCANLAEKVKEDTLSAADLRASDLEVVSEDGFTLIMLAAMHDRVHNLAVMLEKSRKSIDAQHAETGLTALGFAAKAGYSACCTELLRHDASVGIRDMKGYMPLHLAVLYSHEAVVDTFLSKFPTSYVGLYTALRLCRKSSIHDKLTAAFEKRQEQIVSPVLRISAMEGDAGKLFCVLEDGDNVNSKSVLDSHPAMMYAVENGHLEVIQLLVEKGLDLKRRDVRTGDTVLHVVSQTGHMEMASYLMDFCRKLGNRSTQTTPRERLLCRNMLDINASNNEKKTPLQTAAEKGYVKLVKLLIDNGATTSFLNQQGTLFISPEYEGATILIETHRNEHTSTVMKLVADKPKKSLPKLAEIFLPRYDHNLRSRHGDTPLMVACRFGREETVKFLLHSAVYANLIGVDEGSDHSEADSGVLDAHPARTPDIYREDLERSYDQADSYGAAELTRSLNPYDMSSTVGPPDNRSVVGSSRIRSYLQDVERPKGLYIYHDSVVSHVCAVNLFDGNTPLHCTIEISNNTVIASALIDADSSVVNMQNDAGLSPVHMACRYGRKKILEKLLSVEGVDLLLVTLAGQLPEELTRNKTLIRMVHKARIEMQGPRYRVDTASLTESVPSLPSTTRASTINFDRIEGYFQSLRMEQSMQRSTADLTKRAPR
ncbi:ankyrin-1-like isoform X2 [Mya arenaria]|uniref:ankyrin-1-like isoform X2 n=1 Tax=Mya arenaria TaxID=6604 RepID=UPI0022E669F7|nr:ankyrin-1-like isoform X2 [Mya arenaria]